MKLSTKGRYSVRLMIDLALHAGEGPILLKEIAERQALSEKYLWQLMPPLKHAGLVMSFRGARGGYTLAKPSAEITLQDIVTAVEGPVYLVDCVDDAQHCARAATCASRDIWAAVAQKIADVLESYTLDELARQQREKVETFTYVI